ncbi:TetR/AcrR family transcriptional regulator [Actinomadura kijaniata]|uniref:AcrR family transcriptional regulator n=1 Tax=Actinomadura namibiensis TaxID=182080 RepID=A0A7W3LVW8_ACTNM|nr:TetR/AcrR family transcriptional regulator [Actinomadura namibiensis]MBA8955222.1 AcrR family transcriptional regulator [Actinomadura namibiensis]
MRTRLSTERRRAQLLAIGAELFANRPYDEVWVEEVAEIAQVSRGLLYHYFPSKRAFFLAIVEAESARLLEASAPDPALPPAEQLRAGLEIYVDYAERNPDGFRVAQRAADTDADIRRVKRARTAAQRDRILAGLAAVTEVDDTTRIAVNGWLAFVTAAILDWLDHRSVTREELLDLCARTLWAAVGADGV